MAQDEMGTVGINMCVIEVIGVSMLFVDGVSDQMYDDPHKL